jgi:hypothetical protein
MAGQGADSSKEATFSQKQSLPKRAAEQSGRNATLLKVPGREYCTSTDYGFRQADYGFRQYVRRVYGFDL